MRRGSKPWFAIILALLTVSCANQKIEIPNYYFFGDKGKYGATRVESLNPEKPGLRIPKSEWDALRIGMVCTDGANVADMQSNIDKLCTQNPFACSYVKDSMEKIKAAFTAMEKAAKP